MSMRPVLSLRPTLLTFILVAGPTRADSVTPGPKNEQPRCEDLRDVLATPDVLEAPPGGRWWIAFGEHPEARWEGPVLGPLGDANGEPLSGQADPPMAENLNFLPGASVPVPDGAVVGDAFTVSVLLFGESVRDVVLTVVETRVLEGDLTIRSVSAVERRIAECTCDNGERLGIVDLVVDGAPAIVELEISGEPRSFLVPAGGAGAHHLVNVGSIYFTVSSDTFDAPIRLKSLDADEVVAEMTATFTREVPETGEASRPCGCTCNSTTADPRAFLIALSASATCALAALRRRRRASDDNARDASQTSFYE